MKDKARVKETMALLDSLEDIPPSLKDYCFQRDTVRAHMMRNAGRFAEGQALLNSMIMRYATTLDAARIQREIGHLKLVQGKFDEAIACYKESQALLATLVGAKSLRYLEAEVAETQRSLTFAQAQKKGR